VEEAVVEEAVVAEDVVGDGEAAIFITTAKAIVNVKIADVPPESATETTVAKPGVAIETITAMACHLCRCSRVC
jgi:hypothetical protein